MSNLPSMLFRTLVRSCSSRAQGAGTKKGKDFLRISILGGDTAVAETVVFQLKVWATYNEIRVHGSTPSVRDIAEDLNQIPTSCRIVPFSGPNQLKHALNKADVVMVYTESGSQKEDVSDDFLFQLNAPVLEKIAKVAVTTCPDAVFAILSPPLNSTVPLFAQVLKDNGVLKAQKILGMVSDMTMSARKMVATKLGLCPKSVWVPMTGGGSPTTLVPVITATRPGGVFLKKEAKKLSEKVRSIRDDIRKVNKGEPASLAPGYAAADLLRAISKGLRGEETDAHPALVRNQVIIGLDYLVLPVHFGLNGISETHAIPDLSSKDFELMDSAVREIIEDFNRTQKYVAKKRTACVACDTPAVPKYRSAVSS